MMKMKYFMYLLVSIFMVTSCAEKTTVPSADQDSQAFRSERPKPGPAPVIEFGESTKFELDNGLKVIVVENNKLPRVSYQLFIDRQPIVEGDKAGYTSMAGTLIGSGTKKRSKAELDEAVDYIGASFSTSSNGMFMSGLSKHNNAMLEIMADVLYNPAFADEEFDKIRTQTLSGLQSSKDDPNAIAGNVTTIVNFPANHPYGEISTEETVENITKQDCIDYYNTYWKPNISYLVVVGNVSADQVKKDVMKTFGDWKKGMVKKNNYPTVMTPKASSVNFVPRDGAAQSVIRVTYPVDFKQNDPDRVPATLMNQILGGGGFSNYLFQNLREDKGYTYGAGSSLSPNMYGASFTASASVRNEVTDSAVTEFLYEMNRIRTEPVSDEILNLVKSAQMGSYARSMESPQTVANRVLNIERYGLPADYYETYLAKVNAVTAADIMRVAQKYIHPDRANIVVVGSKDEAKKLAKFTSGKIQYLDEYGQPKNMDAKTLPAGLTAGDVISRYLEAIGGKDKLSGLSDMTRVMNMEGGPAPIQVKIMQMAPDKMKQEVGMSGMVLQKTIVNGDVHYQESQGQVVPVDDATKADMTYGIAIIPEMHLADKGLELKLESIEDVNGEDAYKISYKYPSGTMNSQYFSVETGLKLKDVSTNPATGMSQTVVYSDYKEVSGVKVPFMMEMQMPGVPVPMKMVSEKVEIDSGVNESEFAVE